MRQDDLNVKSFMETVRVSGLVPTERLTDSVLHLFFEEISCSVFQRGVPLETCNTFHNTFHILQPVLVLYMHM